MVFTGSSHAALAETPACAVSETMRPIWPKAPPIDNSDAGLAVDAAARLAVKAAKAGKKIKTIDASLLLDWRTMWSRSRQ
jgi:hypothetical protein